MKLELAWEGVQDKYATYANTQAYKSGLKQFCSFGEKTYLIYAEGDNLKAYFDSEEFEEAATLGLKDFLTITWRDDFKRRAKQAIFKQQKMKKKFDSIDEMNTAALSLFMQEITAVLNEVFTVFLSCQPQYTAYLPKYLEEQGLGPATIATLSLPTKISLSQEEEIAWSKIVNANNEDLFEEYLSEYKYFRAADGLDPWSEKLLSERLTRDKNNSDILNAEPHIMAILKKNREIKNTLLADKGISKEIQVLFSDIIFIGEMRLALRINGWMQASYMIVHVLKLLSEKLDYAFEQLSSCTHEELAEILNGNEVVAKEELGKRSQYAFYGLLDGELVYYSGDEARTKHDTLVQMKIERELRGQITFKGHVTGEAYVINWHSESLGEDIQRMPEGAILVAGQTRPQLMSAIKKASAIVTDEGGMLSHAAIVSRELQTPAVIGTKYATKSFKTGDLIEVDANTGVVSKI